MRHGKEQETRAPAIQKREILMSPFEHLTFKIN
jgi:hypothetical protein